MGKLAPANKISSLKSRLSEIRRTISSEQRNYATSVGGAASSSADSSSGGVIPAVLAQQQSKGANEKGHGEEKAKAFWMRDPATGVWKPEDHFGEIDVADLRAKLLPSGKYKTDKQQAQQQSKGANEKGQGVENAKASWMRDPATGVWKPEDHFAEIDVADLRAKLLPSGKYKTDKQQAQQQSKGANEKGHGEENAKASWMRDPATGVWKPEDHFGEIDVADLRAKLLPSAKYKTDKQQAQQESKGANEKGNGEEKAKAFWMRDPATGVWKPEDHFGEIDVADLRAKFLPSGKYKTDKQQAQQQSKGGNEKGHGEEKAKAFWMRDPATGAWKPEDHFDEIDVVDLRAKLLPSGKYKTDKQHN